MKHILTKDKLFEQFNDYYQSIDYSTWYDFRNGDKFEPFSKSDIDFLNKFQKDIYGNIPIDKLCVISWTNITGTPDRCSFISRRRIIGSSFHCYISYNEMQGSILKIKDDYFSVRLDDKKDGGSNSLDIFYKCDQLEGLKKLLRDKGFY